MSPTPFEVSNPDKVFFPAIDASANRAAHDDITKREVVEYYRRIAPHLLPHVARRPLVLERYPDGIDGDGFFQKNTPDHVPDSIERVAIATADGGTTRYAVLDDDDDVDLAYLADQGAIVFHALLGHADDPDRPVEVVWDLDPSGDDLEPVRLAARELRSVLDDLGLEPRVKSTGSRGLHVVVDVIDGGAGPNGRGGGQPADYELTKRFARAVAEEIEPRGPFTLEQRKDQRGGRLFLDVLRNSAANHAVAAYSLRPLPEAPVAAPLDWDEALSSSFHPRRITLRNVFRRLGQTDDPWADPTAPRTTIADALAALGDS